MSGAGRSEEQTGRGGRRRVVHRAGMPAADGPGRTFTTSLVGNAGFSHTSYGFHSRWLESSWRLPPIFGRAERV
jgi:hypothetical protein